MKKIVCVLLLCTSCIQRYEPPPLNTPQADAWKAPQELPITGAVCPEPEVMLEKVSFRPWWKVFQDPILDDLEDQAVKNSPTVQAAMARLEQAYAAYGISLSAMFPEITLDTSASREHVSQTLTSNTGSVSLSTPSSSASRGGTFQVEDGRVTGMTPASACSCPVPTLKVSKPSSHINHFAILPTLTYELDFWGKNWQAMQAAEEQIKASEEDIQTALLILTTSVADTYLQVRAFDAEIAILERLITSNIQNRDLTAEQYKAGLVNSLPVSQAEAQAEGNMALLEEVRRFRALAEHALAELIGLPASNFTLVRDNALPSLPVIPAAVPSEVLKQRPDVRQQINLMNASSLNVGVAKTEYFPDFNITLDYGYVSGKANKLFKWKSHTWLTAVDAITPIFTAGRISSTIDQAIAQYKQQVASYISTVLTAFQEVEDAIYSVDAIQKQLVHLAKEVAASTEAYNTANTRYRMGLENYLVVTVEESSMLLAARLEIQTKRAQYSTTVSLIRSLGGVWE